MTEFYSPTGGGALKSAWIKFIPNRPYAINIYYPKQPFVGSQINSSYITEYQIKRNYHMKFGMGVGLNNPRNTNAEYALEFNGTNEYLYKSIYTGIALFNSSTVTGGNSPTNWTIYSTCNMDLTNLKRKL